MLCRSWAIPRLFTAEGRAARALIDDARQSVAALAGAEAKNVVFTSGGTEAIATVLSRGFGQTKAVPGVSVLFVGATEHACVLSGGQFDPSLVSILPVDGDGLINSDILDAQLRQASTRGHRALVSLQLANNETGVIQPIANLAALVHAHRGLLHVDAVQAAGKIGIDIRSLGADVLTLSAHKFGGPKGVGAIVFADQTTRLARSLFAGGGQERGLRAGTENVAGIAGMGVAASLVEGRLAQMIETGRLRDKLEMGIRVRAPEAVFFGAQVLRLPNTICCAISGLPAETALIGFDMDGVAISSGSACSSGKVKASHVLAAMGVDAELSRCAIRISLGWTSTEADVAHCLTALENRLKTLNQKGVLAA